LWAELAEVLEGDISSSDVEILDKPVHGKRCVLHMLPLYATLDLRCLHDYASLLCIRRSAAESLEKGSAKKPKGGATTPAPKETPAAKKAKGKRGVSSQPKEGYR
jgi:hypothetical protein